MASPGSGPEGLRPRTAHTSCPSARTPPVPHLSPRMRPPTSRVPSAQSGRVHVSREGAGVVGDQARPRGSERVSRWTRYRRHRDRSPCAEPEQELDEGPVGRDGARAAHSRPGLGPSSEPGRDPRSGPLPHHAADPLPPCWVSLPGAPCPSCRLSCGDLDSEFLSSARRRAPTRLTTPSRVSHDSPRYLPVLKSRRKCLDQYKLDP